MISLGVTFYFVSVYLLYATAKRVEYRKQAFSIYWESRPLLAKGLSLLFAMAGTALIASRIDITSALLSSLLIWPLLASIVVLFAPLLNKLRSVYIVLALLALLIGLIYL